MHNYISLQVKFLLPVILGLLILPMTANSENLGVSHLIDDLRNVLIDAEAANTQLVNIALHENKMCKELLKAHEIVHNLHSTVENMDLALGSSVFVDKDAIKVFDSLSSVFVNLATRSSDLSLNSVAVKCIEDMPAYNEGMSTMLGLANDIGSMADHILKMSDKILLKSGLTNEMAKPMLLSQEIQNDNLKLTQALILVAQRNSLASVTAFTNSSYNAGLDLQIFTGQVLSLDAATTFLTRFNMEREWGHIETGVDGLVSRVNDRYKKIREINQRKTLPIDKDSYIAMADLSVVIKSFSVAIEKMAVTTERLSFATEDKNLRESINSMMRITTQIVDIAEMVQEMADIILARGNDTGLSSEQLVAAQQLQSINYATTLRLVESAQGKAVSIIAINSL